LAEISERYNALQLRGFCLYFLLKEFEAVSKTDTFKSLSPDIVEEIQKHKKMPATRNSQQSDKAKTTKDDKCGLM
jgi:hypothetical protein